jgi:phosphate transport system protein
MSSQAARTDTPQQTKTKLAESLRPATESAYTGILERTVRAYLLAQDAAAALADALATKSNARFEAVEKAEKELDRLDREIDATVASAIAEVEPGQARELLSTVKMIIDLERIGDLLASVAGCGRALGARMEAEDVGELIRIVSILERMLADSHGAFLVRNVDRAMAVLRMDGEIDRLRNLLIIRHLEQAQFCGPQQSIHVLFMAQSLERAGDHAKNLAEEICHLVSGRTLRHLLPRTEKSEEQMYLEWLRRQHGIEEPLNEAAAHD